MSSLVISSNTAGVADSIAELIGRDATVAPTVGFDDAVDIARGADVVVSHASATALGHDAATAIQGALRHHVAWLRAMQALPDHNRAGRTCVALTDVSGDGRVVAASVSHMVRSIHTDFPAPARHYAVEYENDLARAVLVIGCLTDGASRTIDLPLVVSGERLSLKSPPTSRRTVNLTPGWTPGWLESMLADQ